jgi:hypothetical protein
MHAGKDAGHFTDVIVIVRWNKLAVFELRCAVGVKFMQADGEELHDLAGIIFVRAPGSGINLSIAPGFFIAEVIEVNAHAGVIGDRFEKIAKITKAVDKQSIVVVAESVGGIGESVGALIGNHEDLAPGVGDTLAKLVGGSDRLLPPDPFTAVREVLSTLIAGLGEKYRKMSLSWLGQLIVDPGGITYLLDAGDFLHRGAKAGLHKKTGSFARRHGNSLEREGQNIRPDNKRELYKQSIGLMRFDAKCFQANPRRGPVSAAKS